SPGCDRVQGQGQLDAGAIRDVRRTGAARSRMAGPANRLPASQRDVGVFSKRSGDQTLEAAREAVWRKSYRRCADRQLALQRAPFASGETSGEKISGCT